MTKLKMAIIDGTGDADLSKYKADMKNSFCVQLERALKSDAYYQRGPSSAGLEVAAEAWRAARFLIDAYQQDKNTRLMLAGYSRGGSAAIMAAELLAAASIPVDSLFLFDAVARHVYPGGEVIPANVKFSRHARRSQDVFLVLKYEGTISDGVGDTSNPMRPSFGNTGLQWKGHGDHELATSFIGSHGALGGVGWPFILEDPECQRNVACFMNGHLLARGVHVQLKAKDPDPGPGPRTPAKMTKIAGAALDILMLAGHGKNLLLGGKKILP